MCLIFVIHLRKAMFVLQVISVAHVAATIAWRENSPHSFCCKVLLKLGQDDKMTEDVVPSLVLIYTHPLCQNLMIYLCHALLSNYKAFVVPPSTVLVGMLWCFYVISSNTLLFCGWQLVATVSISTLASDRLASHI